MKKQRKGGAINNARVKSEKKKNAPQKEAERALRRLDLASRKEEERALKEATRPFLKMRIFAVARAKSFLRGFRLWSLDVLLPA